MKIMHAEDEHDDKLVAEEMALNVHTRAQMRVAEAKKVAGTALTADRQAVLPVNTEEAEILQDSDNDDQNEDTFSEKLVLDPLLIPNLSFSAAPRRQLAKPCASVDVDIHDDLANHSEIASRALLKHSAETILPSNYAPHGIVPKDGEIRVTGMQAKKISKHKAVLVVKILSPASLKDTEIQLFSTSLEPKTRVGLKSGNLTKKNGNLTLLTAIRKTQPHAKTLHDIGVRNISDADTPRIMLTHVTHRGIHWSRGQLIENQRKTLGSNTTKTMRAV